MKKFKKIIKRILIAILIILIGGVVLTKCTNCGRKDEVSVAYAAEEDRFISTYSYGSFDFNNNLMTYPYLNFSGHEATVDYNNYMFNYERFTNIPNGKLTIEFFNNNSNTTQSIAIYIYYKNGGGHSVFPVPYNTYTPLKSGYFVLDWSDNYEMLSINFSNGVDAIVNYNFNFYFYSGDYVPGYGQGLAAGLQQGYNKGVEDSQYGAFKGATVDITQEFSDRPNQTFKNLIPNYIYQGIDTLNLSQYYDLSGSDDGDYLDSCVFTINFSEPWIYDQNQNTLFFTGDLVGLTGSGTIITPEEVNNRKIFEIKVTGALLSENNQPVLISQISFRVGRPTDLGKWWLNSVNTGTADYNSGYNTGYQDGLNAGDAGGYKAGYDKGYAEGEGAGYSQALAEGVSQMGLFTAAISFIRLFFQLVTSFLETKIAGEITLGLLVIGLPAAFMIVNLSIGLVKKLLGARGASEGDD